MADVPQVTVPAVAGIGRERKVDAMLFAIFDFVFPGLHGPQVGHTPGGNDFQVRGQGFNTQFKTDLVVAFACGAVADGGGAFFAGNLYQAFGDGRPGHGSAKQIFIFVNSVSLYTRHDIIVAEIVYQVFDV